MTPPASHSNLVLFEDEHLLVINKPAGWNTHAPSPYAGEGVYDWLRHREPRWASLAIIHRLDKETSGVMVFGKTPDANRSLTTQFTEHQVRKRYRFLTDREPRWRTLNAESLIARAGDRHVSRPLNAQGERAETRFRVVGTRDRVVELEAQPRTGRTHQIRVHAAEHGVPILGDSLYGGGAAARLCLHAESLSFRHPVSGIDLCFEAAPDFETDPRDVLRRAVIDPDRTDAFRILHGASDGWPGCYVDQLNEVALMQSEEEPDPRLTALLEQHPGIHGIYWKQLTAGIQRKAPDDVSPRLIRGHAPAPPFHIRENGVRFEIRFTEGYSVGLFLDQRDNRRRFLTNHVGAGFPLFPGGMAGQEVLNTFAYTCGFSVCAALAGARTTSLDLSRKYLEWGRRNFAVNDLNPDQHGFLYGDTFNWLGRLARKARAFGAVILDPPTFSQSKESGVFRAEKDYGRLVTAALGVLRPDGVLLASANAAVLKPEHFVESIEEAVRQAGRRILARLYVPQPPDFPISRSEPAYLKTMWVRVN